MKKFIKLSLLIFVVILSFSMIGCDSFWVEVFKAYDISGEAVNVKAGSEDNQLTKISDTTVSLVGASVRLENEQGSLVSSGTVSSTGSYDMSEVEAGRYILTGEKSGWVFVPVYVEISGDNQTLPPLMAYPNDEQGAFTVILAWEDISYDLDLISTIPDGTDADSNREIVNWSNPLSSTVSLDRDITAPASVDYSNVTDAGIPRVETISIGGAPDNVNGFGTADDTDLRFFVDNYGRYNTSTGTKYTYSSITGLNADLVEDHPSAWATVYAMKGNEHYGTWELPYNTWENTLQVLTMRFTTATDFTITTSDPDIHDYTTRNISSNSVIGVGVENIY